MEVDEVKRTHFKVIRFILESGAKLHMKSVPIATAAAVYHKFFKECNLDDYDPYLIGMTSLYLAGKIEEDLVKVRDVINVCYKTLHKAKPALDISSTFWTLREAVVQCELLILRMIQFHVSFDNPHKFLLHYMKSLSDWLDRDVPRLPYQHTAWALLRDSYHGDLCLRYPAEHLAVSILYLALQCHGIQVPHSHQAANRWWEVFTDDLTLGEIRRIISEIIDIYNMENLV